MSYMAIATALVEVAPLIKKIISNPSDGEVAAKKVSHIATQLTHHRDPDKIALAFQNNPELLLSFYQRLMTTEKEIYLAMLNDRERARSRTTSLRSTALLCISVCGLFACLYCLSHFSLPSDVCVILSATCGVFASCLKDIYAFEFSSAIEFNNG